MRKRTYHYAFSAVVDNAFSVVAENDEEANIKRAAILARMVAQLKSVCDGRGENWDYDGNTNDESTDIITETYSVNVTDTYTTTYDVEARSWEEAVSMASRMADEDNTMTDIEHRTKRTYTED